MMQRDNSLTNCGEGTILCDCDASCASHYSGYLLADEHGIRRPKMRTHRAKFLSAAVIAAGLIATVAIARTVHTNPHAAGTQVSHSSAAHGPMSQAPRNGAIVCGMANASDCEKIGPLLPM
jgi:hypothetical protein